MKVLPIALPINHNHASAGDVFEKIDPDGYGL
jgi:hypothetical protein